MSPEMIQLYLFEIQLFSADGRKQHFPTDDQGVVLFMSADTKLIVVNSEVLPDVFCKVLDVKKLLATGDEKSSAAACKRVGISRSAFYKYRDCVFTYEEKLTQKIISLYMMLRDEPGVLSGVLAALHSMNTNILTVNQSIPVDGVAAVSISVRLVGGAEESFKVKTVLSELNGVVDIKILSGE